MTRGGRGGVNTLACITYIRTQIMTSLKEDRLFRVEKLFDEILAVFHLLLYQRFMERVQNTLNYK